MAFTTLTRKETRTLRRKVRDEGLFGPHTKSPVEAYDRPNTAQPRRNGRKLMGDRSRPCGDGVIMPWFATGKDLSPDSVSTEMDMDPDTDTGSVNDWLACDGVADESPNAEDEIAEYQAYCDENPFHDETTETGRRMLHRFLSSTESEGSSE